MIEDLGVGIVYFPDSQPFLESNHDLLDYLEIEPQTFWFKRSGLDSYYYHRELAHYLKGFNKPFLLHGVGFPVGSAFQDNSHTGCLLEMIKELDPKWMSEHLSFNTFDFNGNKINTNFLLPPLQISENCKLISNTIKAYKNLVKIPFAFETSTNYLKKQPFELDDGCFVSQIAQTSDSYILLDIHNIWANQLNGRQSVDEFMEAIPQDRVIEIHLAGGFWFKNYYLDAHSGPASNELLELSSKIVRRLPQLRGITFEILPDYLTFVDPGSLRKNIEAIKRLWDVRGKDCHLSKIKVDNSKISTISPAFTPMEWENTLGAISLRMIPEESVQAELLKGDEGVRIIQELIDRFRAAALLSTLKFTCRYINKVHGKDHLFSLFRDFWNEFTPKLFAIETGLDFANYLIKKASPDLFSLTFMKELINYEYNSLMSIYNGADVEYLSFVNPVEVVNCLEEDDLEFKTVTPGNFQIRIEKGDFVSDLNKMNAAFHS